MSAFSTCNWIAGLFLRVFFLLFDGIETYSFGRSFSYLLVGFANMNDHVKECAFLASKNILHVNNSCEKNNMIFDSLYSIMTYFDDKDQDLALKLVALVVQLASFAILHWMWDEKDRRFSHSLYLYWMNPIVLLSCGLSASVCVHHLVLIICYYMAYRGWSVGLVLSMTVLCSSNSLYFVTIPAFVSLLFDLSKETCSSSLNLSANDNRLSKVDKVGIAMKTLAVALIVVSATYLYDVYGVNIKHALDFNDILLFAKKLPHFVLESVKNVVFFKRSRQYTPAAGVLWYLKAQMFIEYGTYFNGLILLTRVFVTFLFSPFIGNIGAFDGVLLTLCSVLYLQEDVCWANMCFLMVALLHQHHVVEKMKFLPLIIIGILVSCAVSTVTFHQWIVIGNGNGNFLFFPGFACWIFWTLGIIEYSKGATSVRNLDVKDVVDTSAHKI